MPPLTLGVFSSTETAGRLFAVQDGAFYRYTSGSLTIQETTTAVPEPATLGLFGMGLAALRGIRRRSSRRQ
jgi:PEP-CTERM motif